MIAACNRERLGKGAGARPLDGDLPMSLLRTSLLRVVGAVASLSFLSACATRPINPPLLHYEQSAERQLKVWK